MTAGSADTAMGAMVGDEDLKLYFVLFDQSERSRAPKIMFELNCKLQEEGGSFGALNLLNEQSAGTRKH